jgi:DNA gyrase subunit A
MFATSRGDVRRNKLSDFVEVRQNGKIAMKLDEGVEIVGVDICTEDDNVLLTTANGQSIRFPVSDVRVFKGRESSGVRGIRLDGDDTVISMAILRHVDATPAERTAYVKQANAIRRAATGEVPPVDEADLPAEEAEENGEGSTELTQQRYAELGGGEQFVLTVSENGFGKRTSAYEYRISGRGGKGIMAMIVNDRNGPLVASFPVEDNDQIMLVTNGGQMIRCPVDGISIVSRSTQGVRIFHTAADERVVAVRSIPEESNGNGNGNGNGHGGHDGPPFAIPVVVQLDAVRDAVSAIQILQTAAMDHPGDRPLHLLVRRANGQCVTLEAGNRYRVSDDFLEAEGIGLWVAG